MEDFCPVELDFSDSSSLRLYEASELVEYVNTWPRFGFPKEFPASLLFQHESNDSQVDNDNQSLPLPYLTGIFMWGCIFSSLLIMYILTLVAYNSHQTDRQPAEATQQNNRQALTSSSDKQSQLAPRQQRLDNPKLQPSSSRDFHDVEGNFDQQRQKAQVYNQIDSQHILRHLQSSSLGTLPQSQYISPTVSRKRLLEAYFDSIMNTSTMLKLGLWNENQAEARPQPNERHLRVITGHSQSQKPRQRWSFSQVFESPREEGDDGSTFQPPPIRQTRTFPTEEESSIASNSIYTTSKTIQGSQHIEGEHPIEISSKEGDGDVSPRTAATASSGSSFGTSRSMAHEGEPESCFKVLTLFSGFMVLLFVILLCSDGLVPLGLQSDAMKEDWEKVMFSSLETDLIVRDVQKLHDSLRNSSTLLYQALDQSCPAVTSSMCTQVGESYSCDLRGIPLNEDWEFLFDLGIQPINITTRAAETYNWTLANQDLSDLITMPFENSLDIWNWILRAAGICNAFLFVLILLVIWSIALPRLQLGIQRKFVRNSRVFLWLFWLSIFCVWCVAIASLAGTFLLSDFCVESPSDETFDLLFGNNDANADQSFLPREFWKYHIDGCPANEYPGESLQLEVEKWSNILGSTTDLQESLQRLPIAQFDLICGDSDQLQELRLATSQFQSELCSLVQSLASLDRSLKCANWYPHFESIIYESVCGHGTIGVGWTALVEWIIVVMSLTVWTFDVWRSPPPNQKPVRTSPATRMGQQQQKKQRLQDDKLSRFPVVPSRSAEESLGRNHQIPVQHAHQSNWSRKPTNSSDSAQLPVQESFAGQLQAQAVPEANQSGWAPLPPNNHSDATNMAQLQTKASFTGQYQSQAASESATAPSKELAGGSSHSVAERGRLPFPVDPPAFDATDGEETVASEAWGSFPDAASMAGSLEIEKSSDQISTGGLDMSDWEQNEEYLPTSNRAATHQAMKNSLPVPRPKAANGNKELAASKLIQVESDSSEEDDLCSL